MHAGAKQILASLVDGGFALKAEVSELEPSTEDVGGATFAVRLEGEHSECASALRPRALRCQTPTFTGSCRALAHVRARSYVPAAHALSRPRPLLARIVAQARARCGPRSNCAPSRCRLPTTSTPFSWRRGRGAAVCCSNGIPASAPVAWREHSGYRSSQADRPRSPRHWSYVHMVM